MLGLNLMIFDIFYRTEDHRHRQILFSIADPNRLAHLAAVFIAARAAFLAAELTADHPSSPPEAVHHGHEHGEGREGRHEDQGKESDWLRGSSNSLWPCYFFAQAFCARLIQSTPYHRQIAPPKQKYIEFLLSGTYSDASLAEIFRILSFRLRDTSWPIVFKALVVIHILIREGSQDAALSYLAENPRTITISGLTDGKFWLNAPPVKTPFTHGANSLGASLQCSIRAITSTHMPNTCDHGLTHIAAPARITCGMARDG